MSQENVDAVRLAIEEFNEGEFGPYFDATLAPKLHFRDELGTLDSRDDLRAYLETFRESFGGLHIEIEQVRDLGDTILFVMNQGGQGRGSGIDVEQHFTWVMTFDRNVCVRWLIYANHEEALEAAGLEE